MHTLRSPDLARGVANRLSYFTIGAGMKIAIITGPRVIGEPDEKLVRDVVREVIARGFKIYVGDAAGVDAIAREVVWNASPHKFFSPRHDLGRTPAGLAERSSRMVKEALRTADGDEVICIGFPNKPCPAGIVPARSWRSGETEGSGTWSTLALCVGHGIKTWIIYTGEMIGMSMPVPPWGFGFSPDEIAGHSAWYFEPAATMFDTPASGDAACDAAEKIAMHYFSNSFPPMAHDALCEGWTELDHANSTDEN